jgi:hypothetical protein
MQHAWRLDAYTEISSEQLQARNTWTDRIILKRRNSVWQNRSHSPGWIRKPVVGFCEHVNEPFLIMKYIIYQLCIAFLRKAMSHTDTSCRTTLSSNKTILYTFGGATKLQRRPSGVRTVKTRMCCCDSDTHKNLRTTQLIYGILFLQISPGLFSDGTARRKDMR